MITFMYECIKNKINERWLNKKKTTEFTTKRTKIHAYFHVRTRLGEKKIEIKTNKAEKKWKKFAKQTNAKQK